jgi:hypothetical protein
MCSYMKVSFYTGSDVGNGNQEDDFFFGTSEAGKRCDDTEVNMYLSVTSKHLGILKNFAFDVKPFLKYNTTIPSSQQLNEF